MPSRRFSLVVLKHSTQPLTADNTSHHLNLIEFRFQNLVPEAFNTSLTVLRLISYPRLYNAPQWNHGEMARNTRMAWVFTVSSKMGTGP